MQIFTPGRAWNTGGDSCERFGCYKAAFLILPRGHTWHPRFALGAVLTLAGTGSNAVNWLVPGYVVGYLRVPFSGLAFNLGDVFALVGFTMACSAAVSGLRPTRA